MKKILILLLIFFCNEVEASSASKIDIALSKKRSPLCQRLVKEGLDSDIVMNTLYDERISLYPEILKRVSGEGYNYFDPVNGIFIEESVNRGKKVIQDNLQVLKQVESEYKIPKEILVAIFRVETNLGRNTGKYVVTNSLLTWIMSGTRREEWATKELFAYLLICKSYKFDPFSIYGSTHGAFGLVQFIPTSYLRFAVDGDKDNKIDLFNFHDAMASVGNYLSLHNGNGNMKKAVYAYNHEWAYVRAVIEYANCIKPPKVRDKLDKFRDRDRGPIEKNRKPWSPTPDKR